MASLYLAASGCDNVRPDDAAMGKVRNKGVVHALTAGPPVGDAVNDLDQRSTVVARFDEV